MGTVPMLCPYKMMFSGLIPYLAEDTAGQRPGTSPGDTAQGSLCSGHSTHKAPSGVWGLSPQPSPSSPWLGPEQFPALPKDQGTARAELPGEFWGVSRLSLTRSGLRGVHRLWTAAVWSSPTSGSHCETGLRKRRQSLAQGCTPNLEGEPGLSLAQQDRKHSLCRGHAPQHPCPLDPPTAPSTAFQPPLPVASGPGFPFWEISCFPDCWSTGLS